MEKKRLQLLSTLLKRAREHRLTVRLSFDVDTADEGLVKVAYMSADGVGVVCEELVKDDMGGLIAE